MNGTKQTWQQADENHLNRVAESLRELGVVGSEEKLVILHEWNCDEFVYAGRPCSCTPHLKYEGPHELDRALVRQKGAK